MDELLALLAAFKAEQAIYENLMALANDKLKKDPFDQKVLAELNEKKQELEEVKTFIKVVESTHQQYPKIQESFPKDENSVDIYNTYLPGVKEAIDGYTTKLAYIINTFYKITSESFEIAEKIINGIDLSYAVE